MAPYGSQLDPIWIQMDPRWIHLDFIWIPSGSHMDPYNSQMDPFGSQIDPIWIHIMDPHGIHMGSIQKCRLKAKRPEANFSGQGTCQKTDLLGLLQML